MNKNVIIYYYIMYFTVLCTLLPYVPKHGYLASNLYLHETINTSTHILTRRSYRRRSVQRFVSRFNYCRLRGYIILYHDYDYSIGTTDVVTQCLEYRPPSYYPFCYIISPPSRTTMLMIQQQGYLWNFHYMELVTLLM